MTTQPTTTQPTTPEPAPDRRRTGFFLGTGIEIREDGQAGAEDQTRIGGLLVPWNTDTIIADYDGIEITERFEPNSITNADKMYYLLGHRRDRAVASSEGGSMTVEDREDGRWVFAALDPMDPDARSLLSKIRIKAVTGQSIGFRCDAEDRIEHRGEGGKLERVEYVIKEATMIEASAVTWPAYKSTTLGFSDRARQRAEVEALVKADQALLPPQRRARIARARLALSMNRRTR